MRKEHILDDSKSGSTDDRPGWRKILALAREGAIDMVYFWKLDRMMRDEYYFYVNEKELRDAGVELRFATQDLADPFNRAIQVAVSAEERRRIRERTNAGKIRAIQDGKWIAPPPYGYRKDRHFRLKIFPREAEWVKKFFSWLVDEQLSLGKIAMRARELRAPTRYDINGKKKPRNGPYFWSKGTLKRILSAEVYAGTGWFRKYETHDAKLDPARQRPENEWIKVSVPPLISVSTLQKARKQLAKNSENATRRTKRTYLFAKKLRCGACGRVLVASGSPKGKYKFYRGTYWTDSRCLECRCYSETALDSVIWPMLIRLFRDPEAFMSVLEKYEGRDSKKTEIEHEQKEIDFLEKRLQQTEKALLDSQLDGFYSRAVLENKKRELAAERKRLEERKHDLSRLILAEGQRLKAIGSARTIYQKIQSKLDNADYETKRHAIDAFIDRVVLLRHRADVWVKLPGEMAIPDVVTNLSATEKSVSPISLPRSSLAKRDIKKRPDNDMSLRRSSHVKRDAKTHENYWDFGASGTILTTSERLSVRFSVEVNPRYKLKKAA